MWILSFHLSEIEDFSQKWIKQQFKENTAIFSEQCLLETLSTKQQSIILSCFQLTGGKNLNVIFYSWTNIWTFMNIIKVLRSFISHNLTERLVKNTIWDNGSPRTQFDQNDLKWPKKVCIWRQTDHYIHLNIILQAIYVETAVCVLILFQRKNFDEYFFLHQLTKLICSR